MSRDSKDRKTWIKIFTVSNPQEHPGGFTVYKVVETTFPTSSPDLACTTTAWKRWSQVKVLYRSLLGIHRALYLSGDFPILPNSSYFHRKEAQIIEERRIFVQEVLEFSASHPALYSSTPFKEFFQPDPAESRDNIRSSSSINSESSLNLSISVSQDLSIDVTPALVPSPVFSEQSDSDSKVHLASEKSSSSSDLSTSTSEQSTPSASNNFIHPASEESTPSASVGSPTFLSALSSPPSECLATPPIESSEESFKVDLTSTPLTHTDSDIKQSNPTNPSNPDPFDPLNAGFIDPAQLFLNQTNTRVNLDLSTLNLQETEEAELPRPTEAACPGEEAGLTNYEDSNGGIPVYITEAAQIIAEALSLEAEEKFDQSIASYRSAIGKLLSSVQADPDATRKAAVKKRVAQYISKAEQLVERELDAKARRPGKKISGIPHLQLFGQLAQLRKYKVVDILDGRLILAQNTDSLEKVVFKVLQKSAAVFKKSKTSLLPINITFMVGLLKYFETDEAVYLMLEYCPAGRLWDVVQPLVQQQLQHHLQAPDDSLASNPRRCSVLKPSESFIIQRTKSYLEDKSVLEDKSILEIKSSVEIKCTLDDDSDMGDISFVHTENSSLLVVSDNQIDHYQYEAENNPDGEWRVDEDEDVKNEYYKNKKEVFSPICRLDELQSDRDDKLADSSGMNNEAGLGRNDIRRDETLDISREILNSLTDQTQENNSGVDLMNKMTGIEEKIKNHIKGNIEPLDTLPQDTMYCDTSICDIISSSSEFFSKVKTDCSNVDAEGSCKKIVFVGNLSGETIVDESDSDDHNSKIKKAFENPRKPVRPPYLRKLSEVLPQFPDPDLPDSTVLPDRVLRLWAAELAQVLTSLHFREIIIKDLNPENVLLDCSGHIKLSYQCEWISVERELSRQAVLCNYTAPEVLTVSEITPAADWWSYGAILLLLYTGSGPVSLIPSGLDSTIPIEYPEYMHSDAKLFISSLLQVYPGNRLGAGSTGSLDVQQHPYFVNFDWTRMMFHK